MTDATNGSEFARTHARRTAPSRDPLGKATLFSAGAAPTEAAIAAATQIESNSDAHGRGASHLFSQTEARAGTLVLDCARCAQRTRVTYAEFAALHLPVWAWVPVPGRSHRHWLRCPSCHHLTWLRTRWFE